MSFAAASALLVALLVVAPLLAHMLRRRRAEEQLFPAARLVPPTQPTARRRSRLEDRALFAIRALAVAVVALLGATPFVRCSHLAIGRKDGANIALAVVVDDSLSMRAKLPSGTTRFARAVSAARDLVGALEEGDAVTIVLAGRPPRVALGGAADRRAALAALDALAPSDRATDLEGAIALARGLVRALPQKDKRVLLLSDLADGSRDTTPLGGDDEIALWAPLDELAANGADCAITRADLAAGAVRARVACSSLQGKASPAAGRSIEIVARGKVIASSPLPAALSATGAPDVRAEEIRLAIPKDAPEALTARLSGEDAIAEDDRAPVVQKGGSLPLAIVVDSTALHVATGGPPPIEQALAALQLDAQVRPLPSTPEHADELASYAALVVDDAPGFTPEVRRGVAAWVDRGGVVLLTLGPKAAAAPLGASFDPLVPGVIRWDTSPPAGVDPKSAPLLGPSVESFASLNAKGRMTFAPEALAGADVLAAWKDGAPLWIRRSIGRGAVFAIGLPLATDESDLALRPAFLALLESFVNAARARGGSRRIEVGEVWTFDGYRSVKVTRQPAGEQEKPAEIQAISEGQRRRVEAPLAGLYRLELDGEVSQRAASVPEREIDLTPRPIKSETKSSTLGGVRPARDVSPHVAAVLLALVALELFLRLRAGKTEDANVVAPDR